VLQVLLVTASTPDRPLGPVRRGYTPDGRNRFDVLCVTDHTVRLDDPMTNAVDRWTWPVYFAAIRAEASWKTLLPCVKDPAEVVDHLRSTPPRLLDAVFAARYPAPAGRLNGSGTSL
jgi:hypothetical protein